MLERHATDLGVVRIDGLPNSVAAAIPLAKGLKTGNENYVPGDELARRLSWSLAAATCVVLVRRGWTLEKPPGRAFRISRGHLVIEPFGEVEAVVFGRTSPTSWIDFCQRAGVTGYIPDLLSQQGARGGQDK